MINKEAVELLRSTLEHLKAQQSKSLELFEQMMGDQSQQMQQYLGLLADQIESTC